MLFIIFTQEGLDEASADILENKASLWLNPALKQESDLSRYEQAGIEIQWLPYAINANDDKAVLGALSFVEKHSSDKAIFIEYL
jgi:hypothetical protein